MSAVRDDSFDRGISSIPSDWPNRDFSHSVDSGGTRWHYQRSGDGETLLLLHGTAASTHTWRDMLRPLAKRYDVIGLDLPGHAFTSRLPDGSMSLPAISSAVATLLRDLDAKPDYIVAHSAGAAVGLNLASQLDSVSALVGVNAALLPFGGAMRHLFAPMAHFFASTRLMPRMLARRAAQESAVRRVLEGTGSSLDAEGLSYYQRLFQREEHIAAVLEMMASWDLTALLDSMDASELPVLLLAGAKDKAVSPREAHRLAERFATFEVADLDGLGHLAHEERPDLVLDAVQHFLESLA